MVTLLDKSKQEPPVLYVPQSAMPNEGEPVLLGGATKAQRTTEGRWISHRTWRLTNPTNGRTQVVCLLDNEMSDDEVATAYGEAKENFLKQTQGLPRLVPPTPEQRRDVGAVLRDIRERRQRRQESTSGRLLF